MKQSDTKPKIIVVLGSTASGKSDLAVFLAKKFNGEIISADSRQVYKGMDIGSAKITKKEMAKIPHYLLDVANPRTQFSVNCYQKLANQAIKKIIAKNKLPIICGGTGLYIDAVINDVQFPNIPPSPTLRKKLEKLSTKELFEKLNKLDPGYAKKIDKNNPRRLIRALEIIIISGKPMPELVKNAKFNTIKIGLKKDLPELKKKITQRTKQRIKKGMISEVKNLHKQGLSWKRLFDFGLEYRYLSLYLQKKIAENEMINSINKSSIQYAKRQMTWFKRDPNIKWIKNRQGAEKTVRSFLKN